VLILSTCSSLSLSPSLSNTIIIINIFILKNRIFCFSLLSKLNVIRHNISPFLIFHQVMEKVLTSYATNSPPHFVFQNIEFTQFILTSLYLVVIDHWLDMEKSLKEQNIVNKSKLLFKIKYFKEPKYWLDSRSIDLFYLQV
jgi:hypothetical protein